MVVDFTYDKRGDYLLGQVCRDLQKILDYRNERWLESIRNGSIKGVEVGLALVRLYFRIDLRGECDMSREKWNYSDADLSSIGLENLRLTNYFDLILLRNE